ncbi:MAG: hypothetical protein ABI274_07715, partial [Ktedonobacterales bacterium]
DRLMKRGHYVEALTLCDESLRITGEGAWTGARRLVWLNRRAQALLALGHADEALAAALEAMEASPDPETIADCALALLRLNRYEKAADLARLALDLTRERSVLGNATLAAVMLERAMPAEAEALARAGRADLDALLPLVHIENRVACLTTLCRAERMQGHTDEERKLLAELRKVTRHNPVLQTQALLEEVDALATDCSAELLDWGFRAVDEAYLMAPHYTLWYVAQPRTLAALHADERFTLYAGLAREEFERFANEAPTVAEVRAAYEVAGRNGRRRPAPQSSREALQAQLFTLIGTLLLLIVWMWRFFLIGNA